MDGHRAAILLATVAVLAAFVRAQQLTPPPEVLPSARAPTVHTRCPIARHDLGPDRIVKSPHESLEIRDARGTPCVVVHATADFVARPAIAPDGVIYAATRHGDVIALDPSGDLRFAVDVGAGVVADLALHPEAGLLVGTLGPRPRVLALDPTTGILRGIYRAPLSDGEEGGYEGPLVVAPDGRVVANRRGRIDRLRWLARTLIEDARPQPIVRSTVPP